MLIDAARSRLRRGGRRCRRAADRARPWRQRSRPRAALAPLALRQVAPRRGRAQAGGAVGGAASERRSTAGSTSMSLAKALALAFPDRVSRRRDASGESWQSVGGRGFRLDPASSLASEPMARGRRSRRPCVGRAHPLRRARSTSRPCSISFADRIETRHDGDFDPATGSVTPTRSRRLGAIRLVERPRSRRPTRQRSSRRCSTAFASMASACCRGTSAALQLRAPRRLRAPLRSVDPAAR